MSDRVTAGERESPGADSARSDLLAIYRAALEAVGGRSAVIRHLTAGADTGRGGGAAPERLAAVAIGKAASAMLEGLFEVIGERLSVGLLISKDGHVDASRWRARPVEVIESAHPVPDERSLRAGQALLAFIGRQPPDRPVWFLISGGASALVEVLRPGVTLGDVRAANHWLLGSGLDILRMNRLRARLSELKSGGLLRYLGDRPSRLLLISDVPGDDPAAIGSGLLVPPPPRSPELRDDELPAGLPACLRAAGRPSAAAPATPAPDPEIVASLDLALDAARRQAESLGYPVIRHPGFLAGDAAELGARLARELMQGEAGVWLWGGETTVRLPAEPGRGGRNQHLALAAALALAGRRDCCLLAAGTDGSDGPTEDAGALVDGGTVDRGEGEGGDARTALSRADAGSFLELGGDLLHTGPTGTNVMDLVIGLRLDRPAESGP